MADQGMTERYAPLSRRLSREKIRRIDKEIMYADMENAGTSRLVRRIVEKRAAQAVHQSMGSHDKSTNRYRQSVRRATSFSLYNRTFAEYDAQLRAPGTHWKVVKQKMGSVFSAVRLLTTLMKKQWRLALNTCFAIRMIYMP